MALDFVVGRSARVADKPAIVGQLEFVELREIATLLTRRDSLFLKSVSNIFADQVYSSREIEAAREDLHQFLPLDLKPAERHVVNKLIAVLSFASGAGHPLHGVAD